MKYHLFSIFLIFFIACNTSEDPIGNEEARMCYGDFSVNSGNQEGKSKNSKEFPFDKLLETTDYNLRVFNGNGDLLHGWKQNITQDFTYYNEGVLRFVCSKYNDYTLPIATYHVEGATTLEAADCNISIRLDNTAFACIAVYDYLVASVSVNGIEDLPIVDSENGAYHYTFTEPNIDLYLDIVDVYQQKHSFFIPASEVRVNKIIRFVAEEGEQQISKHSSATTLQFVSENQTFPTSTLNVSK